VVRRGGLFALKRRSLGTPRLSTTPEAIALYREILHRHLTDRAAGEVDFFVNDRRFALMRQMMGNGFEGKSILNVASGPFAFEVFVAPKGATVDSFDIDPLLPAVHEDLRAKGLIDGSTFVVSDVMSFSSDKTYDVILINDLFFMKVVDFYAALPRYTAMLNPGGVIYFDILDERAGAIWAVVNNDPRYRRYSMDEVKRALTSSGLELIGMRPSPGIKGGLDGAARRLMWAVARIANNCAFLARKPG
jgi:hypothetical protein